MVIFEATLAISGLLSYLGRHLSLSSMVITAQNERCAGAYSRSTAQIRVYNGKESGSIQVRLWMRDGIGARHAVPLLKIDAIYRVSADICVLSILFCLMMNSQPATAPVALFSQSLYTMKNIRTLVQKRVICVSHLPAC